MKYKVICSEPELLLTDSVLELLATITFETSNNFLMTEDDGVILECSEKPADIKAGNIEIKFEEIE
jgi:hypothetical protein